LLRNAPGPVRLPRMLLRERLLLLYLVRQHVRLLRQVRRLGLSTARRQEAGLNQRARLATTTLAGRVFLCADGKAPTIGRGEWRTDFQSPIVSSPMAIRLAQHADQWSDL